MTRTYPLRPLVGVGAVVLRDDRVLLVRRGTPPRQGEWSIPGGAQRLGETLREAFRREIEEETSLVLEPMGLIDVVDYIDRDNEGTIRYHYTLIDYWSESHNTEPHAGDDATETRWVALGEIGTYGLWRKTVRIITRGAMLRDLHHSITE